mmetsp:Transcript_11008/g.16210  ORF Transcript_11008/g.16210 Transcript_11008/m.16210 type:complete len:166 (-) Transcript_11008:224-721(-)|eukprot:CAMPEP_0113945094 /NCGR_PEP_ID=MMETSP1339-20121228/38482_1 /TAXON_ID=94617 /ORGANISM="Fibrocapsa japonica" /LENGTH=165 /DNA_ID=CAMNT_0000950501 /DNA_START=126 /DNA_END=623 /DNA_ORIENTATION=+ /assembly_acc=CAM_ASM_000762
MPGDLLSRSAKAPVELCAWVTLIGSALTAWDSLPEYNFVIAVFALISARSAERRLISYMALTVPLLVLADIVFFFKGLGNVATSSSILFFIMFVVKVAWAAFAALLMLENDGSYLEFLDCFRGTINWFRGLPTYDGSLDTIPDSTTGPTGSALGDANFKYQVADT